jgi:hypothetical protein
MTADARWWRQRSLGDVLRYVRRRADRGGRKSAVSLLGPSGGRRRPAREAPNPFHGPEFQSYTLTSI